MAAAAARSRSRANRTVAVLAEEGAPVKRATSTAARRGRPTAAAKAASLVEAAAEAMGITGSPAPRTSASRTARGASPAPRAARAASPAPRAAKHGSAPERAFCLTGLCKTFFSQSFINRYAIVLSVPAYYLNRWIVEQKLVASHVSPFTAPRFGMRAGRRAASDGV